MQLKLPSKWRISSSSSIVVWGTPDLKPQPLNRTRARELALRVLYQYDVCSKLDSPEQPGPDEFRAFLAEQSDDTRIVDYAIWLVEGTLASLDTIDPRIEHVTQNWKLQRLAAVDRSVLRLALFELLHSEDVPPKVTMSEAIDLAKKYSTEQSGAFVNGVLDRIYNDTQSEKKGAGTPESE